MGYLCSFNFRYVLIHLNPKIYIYVIPWFYFAGFAYVGSIYIWRSEFDRDHPETIKRRFVSAFFTSCLCPPLVYIFGNAKLLGKPWLNIFSYYQKVAMSLTFENNFQLTCLWHQKLNSPILQFSNLKCCIKAKEPYKTPF